MKYYTKEWYNLMQNLNYATDMEAVPDKEYSDEEIHAFYEKNLAEEVENTTKFYALMRQSFDLADIIQSFEDSYRARCEHGLDRYPAWVKDSVDSRLAALGKLPESVYERLQQEDEINREKFHQINDAAKLELDQQDIPEEVLYSFYFQDAEVLSLKEAGNNTELYLKTGDGLDDGTPYTKIIFCGVSLIEREDGLNFEKTMDEYGIYCSDCRYLYEEVYRIGDGYEVHLMLSTPDGLRYLTVTCEDLYFEYNVEETQI